MIPSACGSYFRNSQKASEKMGVHMDGNEKEKEGEEESVCRSTEGLFIGISLDN